MAAKRITIDGKKCFLYENSDTNIFLIQAVGEHELDALDREVEGIKKLTSGVPFAFAAIMIEDWNGQLSPWKAPAVFGKAGFGSGAEQTLTFVRETLLPTLEQTYRQGRRMEYYLGGYSLSGLFSLWASYQTDIFSGIAAVSPSVWFPGWDAYMTSHSPQAQKIYLSLGEKEEKTKNRVTSQVGDHIRRQDELLRRDEHVKACFLEWNPGNHFTDPEIRMAKGFAWLLTVAV